MNRCGMEAAPRLGRDSCHRLASLRPGAAYSLFQSKCGEEWQTCSMRLATKWSNRAFRSKLRMQGLFTLNILCNQVRDIPGTTRHIQKAHQVHRRTFYTLSCSAPVSVSSVSVVEVGPKDLTAGRLSVGTLSGLAAKLIGGNESVIVASMVSRWKARPSARR